MRRQPALARLLAPGVARVLVLALTLARRGVAARARAHRLSLERARLCAHLSAALMQSAAVFGIYGLTLCAVLIFAGPLVLMARGEARHDA